MGHGDPWTPEEDGIIKSSNLTKVELARRFDRSTAAVGVRASQLGVSLRRGPQYWTTDELDILRHSQSLDQMVELTGRSRHAITRKLCELRRSGEPLPMHWKGNPSTRVCEIEGCGRKHSGRGLCQKHYQIAYPKRRMSAAQRRVQNARHRRGEARRQSDSPQIEGRYRPWTPAEDAVVMEDISNMEKAWVLGRSYGSVVNRIKGIRAGRIKGSRSLPFSPEEIEILMSDVSSGEAAEIIGRSVQSVVSKRSLMRAAGAPIHNQRRRWTDEEDHLIRSSELSTRELARKLERTEQAVLGRAGKMGVSMMDRTEGSWSSEELSIIQRTDLTLNQMADLIGRTYGAVYSKRHALRKRGCDIAE